MFCQNYEYYLLCCYWVSPNVDWETAEMKRRRRLYRRKRAKVKQFVTEKISFSLFLRFNLLFFLMRWYFYVDEGNAKSLPVRVVLIISRFKTFSCPLFVTDWPFLNLFFSWPFIPPPVRESSRGLHFVVGHTVRHQVHWWWKAPTSSHHEHNIFLLIY